MHVPLFTLETNLYLNQSQSVRTHSLCGIMTIQALIHCLDRSADHTFLETHHTCVGSKHKLELLFMKHYAPNRCLYIKVAKLRTGLGCAEMSHLQNCSLKIYLKSTGGRFGGGGQDRCERRIKVFCENSKKENVGGGRVWGSE